jgi:hypothetical protein
LLLILFFLFFVFVDFSACHHSAGHHLSLSLGFSLDPRQTTEKPTLAGHQLTFPALDSLPPPLSSCQETLPSP